MRIYFSLSLIIFMLSGCATDSAIKEIESEFVMPKEVTAVVDEARRAAGEGDLLAAREKYLQLIKDNPNDVLHRIEYASILFRLGAIEQAKGEYLEVVKQSRCAPREALGVLTVSPGGTLLTEETRLRYCSVALNSLGVITDMDGDYAKAENYYLASLNAYNRDVSVYNNYGYSLLMSRRFRTAEQIFKQGVQIDPYAQRVKHNLALAMAWQKKYKVALNTYSSQASAKGYNNIGYIALLNKDYDEAIDLFEHAIRISPSYYVKAGLNLDKAKIQAKEARETSSLASDDS